ncbi:hypothetical protein ACOSQ3_017300 [Xanthoceras sorbifolium]
MMTRAYYEESKWLCDNLFPSFEDYMRVALVSVGGSSGCLGDAAGSRISGAGSFVVASSTAAMWTAPARGALKINVDASIPLASGVGLGLVIRDSTSFVLAVATLPLSANF